ncbi:MAG TPA: class I SAM-dependent methyltransferase, partial [Myxococcaceae bacterium]
MNLTFRRLGVSELLPRYIFAESLFVRRRVLEVGAVAATGGASAEFLVSRGARLVVACDDDLTAVEAAQSRAGSDRLRFRPAVFDDLPPGGFDLVLVADLAPYVRAPALLAQLTEQVSGTGVLVGGVRNPAGLALAQLMEPDGDGAPPTFGQVLDALSAQFPHVETATQSPLLGYQLAFERSEGLQVDGSLAGAGEAAYYVVLASRERLRAVDPTWVQLPPAPLAFTGGRLDEASTRAREWEERARRLKSALGEAREEL